MNRTENNGQFDTDILQCRVDILRARNVVPLHDNTASKKPKIQNDTETKEPVRYTDSRQAEASAREGQMSQEKSDIPRFDLAEEIMAEQRRITAIKRKGPGVKGEIQRLKPDVRPVEHTIKEPKPELSEQEKIIAEIVARDIESMCRGDYSG